MKIQGQTSHSDLEGGYYTLKTAKGDIYKLEGGGPELYQKGLTVDVEGHVESNSFGIGFGTPVLYVSSYRIKT